MSTYIKIVLLALSIAVWLPRDHAIALPYTKPFTPVVHKEVKQVVVYADREKYLKLNCEALRPIFALYDWNVDMALEISKHESGCNPSNHNYKDIHKTCTGSWNALNVGCIHYLPNEDIDDLHLNVAKGYKIYTDNHGSFKKWTTCKDIVGCK